MFAPQAISLLGASPEETEHAHLHTVRPKHSVVIRPDGRSRETQLLSSVPMAERAELEAEAPGRQIVVWGALSDAPTRKYILGTEEV